MLDNKPYLTFKYLEEAEYCAEVVLEYIKCENPDRVKIVKDS